MTPDARMQGPAHGSRRPEEGMSGFAEYEQYDALGLAELVRRGKVQFLSKILTH
jgi:hypothetical protein